MKRLATAFAITIALCTSAFAHPHHHRYVHVVRANNFTEGLGYGLAHMLDSARPSDCYGIPWCGCYMRHVYGVSDKAYNLARSWANFGHSAGGPHVGVIVVWSYHVGRIVGGSPGHWKIESGNFNNRVAVAEIPLRGVIAYREP